MYASFEELSDNSKLWIYQSNRPFNENELFNLERGLKEFCDNWTAHNKSLLASFKVPFNRFIILAVDESRADASGCSIDKSVNFMKVVEREFGVELFDRLNFAYLEGDEVRSLNRTAFEEALGNGLINDNTVVFNNLIGSKGELQRKWQVRFADSWHKDFFMAGKMNS